MEDVGNGSVWDVGSRTLTSKELGHLQYVTRGIFDSILTYNAQYEAACKIAEIMLANDIQYKCACQALHLMSEDLKIVGIVEKTYTQKEDFDTLPLHEILQNNGLDSKSARKISKEVWETLKEDISYISAAISHNSLYINNTHYKRIILEKELGYNEKTGESVVSEHPVVNAAIQRLVVYDNPLDDDPRQFKATFISRSSKRPFIIGPEPINDIIVYLVESGYVPDTKMVKEAIPALFYSYIVQGKAEIRNEIEYPGFYYTKTENKIINIKYPLKKDIKLDDLVCSLELLETLKEYYCGQEDKLAHVLKWGLISPFIFAIKQRGRWIPHLYLYGKARSGKTTLAALAIYLYATPDNENNIGGSGFNSEARIGEKLRQSTFPLIVNEPESVLGQPGLVEMLKTAIERTNSRGKFVGRQYKNILALAPVIYTSNHMFPDDDALIRRMDCISFSYNERKTDKKIEEFTKHFQTDNSEQCRLHGLKPLAYYFANELINKPEDLDLDWKELTNLLLTRIYMDISREIPDWLLRWSKTESLDDYDDIIIGRLRSFLRDEINKAHGSIEIIDENGRRVRDKYEFQEGVKTTKDFYDRVWTVLNENKISYLHLGRQNQVFITREFTDKLSKHEKINDSLKSISELLQWKYESTKLGEERKSIKVIKTKFDKFLEFVYPTFQ